MLPAVQGHLICQIYYMLVDRSVVLAGYYAPIVSGQEGRVVVESSHVAWLLLFLEYSQSPILLSIPLSFFCLVWFEKKTRDLDYSCHFLHSWIES